MLSLSSGRRFGGRTASAQKSHWIHRPRIGGSQSTLSPHRQQGHEKSLCASMIFCADQRRGRPPAPSCGEDKGLFCRKFGKALPLCCRQQLERHSKTGQDRRSRTEAVAQAEHTRHALTRPRAEHFENTVHDICAVGPK